MTLKKIFLSNFLRHSEMEWKVKIVPSYSQKCIASFGMTLHFQALTSFAWIYNKKGWQHQNSSKESSIFQKFCRFYGWLPFAIWCQKVSLCIYKTKVACLKTIKKWLIERMHWNIWCLILCLKINWTRKLVLKICTV